MHKKGKILPQLFKEHGKKLFMFYATSSRLAAKFNTYHIHCAQENHNIKMFATSACLIL